MQQPSVLICGAGPTGLVLAIWLTKAGVPVRIIDAADKPGTTSRATVVHARTLELYHQLGIERGVIERGIEFKSGNVWVRGKKVASIAFGDEGRSISPYPYTIIFPQDRHEALLIEELAKLNVQVERSTSLLSFEEHSASIIAQLRKPNGSLETCEAAYLAGCDGAHSAVRHGMVVSFPGGTYEDMFYVADLRINGPLANGEMNAAVDDADFLFVFPMKGEGRVRLVGAIKQSAKDKQDLQWSDVSESILRRMKLDVQEVYWFSAYHVHHRVAEHFRKGRAFLLGDAGHIHSPVGGQGMNTGIGDAVNLAWKLAAVIKDNAPQSLLDTYEQERIAFAKTLVSTTDRVFSFVDKRSAIATFIRTRIVPPLLRLAFRLPAMRKLAFLTVSQTKIEYRRSALSRGEAGHVQGGDRLPWLPQEISLTGEPDNYEPLGCCCWQVHCYGQPSDDTQQLCKTRALPLCVFPYNHTSQKAGLRKDALYVVRPDGYIGFALADADAAKLTSYLNQWQIGVSSK